MKLILLTAAALVAAPLAAQTSPGAGTPTTTPDPAMNQNTPPTTSPTDPSMATPNSNSGAPMTTQSGNTGGMTTGDQQGGMQQGGMSNGGMSNGGTSNGGMANGSMANGGMSGGAMAGDGNYAMCSRTVTDHCMERSNARGERLHSTPRPRRRR